eukprot:scaffold127447_cov20-Prasinocladus_malaysianus.AAC.1
MPLGARNGNEIQTYIASQTVRSLLNMEAALASYDNIQAKFGILEICCNVFFTPYSASVAMVAPYPPFSHVDGGPVTPRRSNATNSRPSRCRPLRTRIYGTEGLRHIQPQYNISHLPFLSTNARFESALGLARVVSSVGGRNEVAWQVGVIGALLVMLPTGIDIGATPAVYEYKYEEIRAVGVNADGCCFQDG